MKKFLLFVGMILIVLTACNRQEAGIDISQMHFRIQSPYGNHYLTGKDIPFEATDANGNDITPSVRFAINGQSIGGSSYRFSAAGDYTVTATWDLGGGATVTADDTIHAHVIAPRSQTRVLIEDFTGTWCVNCPRVIYHLEQAMQQVPGIVPVAIHNRGYNTDPFHYDGVETLASEYGINAYPTPLINRTEVWDETTGHVQQYLQEIVPLGISVHNALNGNQWDITVKVRFDMDLQRDTLRLVVFVTEDHLHADQANTTSYYGGQNPIPNFEHNHVLRHSFTDPLGDAIPQAQQTFDNEYTWTYSGPVPAAVSDPANMRVTAFVVRGTNQAKTVNVNEANVNENADY